MSHDQGGQTQSRNELHRFAIGVPPHTKLLRLDRYDGAWCLWIHHNTSFTAGTCLVLHDTGTCERVIINPDGTEEHFTVVP